MPSWLTHQRWPLILVAGCFSLYLVVLLSNAYQSQGQLRAAAEARLLVDTQQIAALMGDFMTDQRNVVLDLAESNELQTFLANKALGTSMHHDLNVNLAAIAEGFQRKIARKRLLGAPVYERILYFDETGVALFDSDAGAPLDMHFNADDGNARLFIDDEHGKIVATAPVDYRGTPGGVVVTASSLDLFLRYLSSSRDNLGLQRILVTGTGQAVTASGRTLLRGAPASALSNLTPKIIIALNDHPGLASTQLAEDFDLVLSVPVAETSLSVVTLLPKALLYDHISPQKFLYFAGAILFILFLATLGISRMHQRAVRAVALADRNRAELQGRKDDLIAEVMHRKTLERQLRESEERCRTYIKHTPEGVFVADLHDRFIEVNPSACAMVGYTRAELLAMRVTDLSPTSLASARVIMLKQVLRAQRKETQIGLRRKDGGDILISLRTIRLPGGVIMGFCADITQRKRTEEQIHRLAYFDPLTGLPNRRLLLDRLRQSMTIGKRNRMYSTLMMLDLDHFKNLNDTQGHDMGDRFLVEVGRRLRVTLRQADVVSRLGGDEYVVIADKLGTDESAAAAQAERIAEKVHHALAAPYLLAQGRATYHSSASIGVALFRGEDIAVDVLLKQADVALYQAKSAGRNTIRFFDPDMQAAIDARALMESALRRAIEGDELRLHYQAQVDRHGTLTGAEVLLRWLPADAASVSPNRFIPLAEETGLIIPIGDWMLKQVCAQLQAWRADARTRALTLSINVSARQFLQPDFIEQVRERIADFGIDATRLKLELNESVVLGRVDQIIARMRALRELGVGFSLDDFGTGYSSLSCLKRLPLDQVKIDRSFVSGVVHNENDAAIVRAILAMSGSLGLDAIAEGVETEEQHAFLLRHGCEHFQGYLFGRPAPIEDLSAPPLA